MMIANCESYSRLADAASMHHAKSLSAKLEGQDSPATTTTTTTTAASDLNEVIQQQLQPLLESVSLNSALAQYKQQQQQHQASSSVAAASVVVGHSAGSNGSSSSTSPLLKTSESSLSPAPSSSSNWQHHHHQNASGAENVSAAAAWTSALYAAVTAASQQQQHQQQISPTLLSQLQQSAGLNYSIPPPPKPSSNGKLATPVQQQQHKQLASFLKAEQPSSGLLHNLHTIYAPTQAAKSSPPAALADVNAKQQRTPVRLMGDSSADDQERSTELTNQMDMYMFNSHLMELIKNYPAQLEQFLKLRNMLQSEEPGLSPANGHGLSEDFQQQIDQIPPANLAAALAAANGRLNTLSANQVNFNRSSPKAAAAAMNHLHHKHQSSMMANASNVNHMQKQQQQSPFPQPYAQNFLNKNMQPQQQQHHFGQFQETEERFSRKVFVGGLPPDIDEGEIVTHFRRYGNLIVDWPHKAESKSYFPPKGYAFLIFQEERNVQDLIETCVMEDGKLYTVVSSPSMKDKPVQIRPWCLADSDFVMDGSQPLDPQKTIFVGGVPRPIKAIELAMIMDRLYGGVCYAGIDTDPKLKYPKGAGRVAFSNQQSYIAAISARFVQLHHGEIDKRVEVKPYVLDDQMCDECQGVLCAGKFAPFFCANITCLQYYCEQCWTSVHSRPGREYHKPLVKEGADRPRRMPFSKS